jgi:Domain of unknown function (DUF4174)
MRVALLLSLLGVMFVSGMAGAQTGVVSLAELRNQSRVLLVFAPKPDDAQLEIQLRRLNEDAAALTERDVVAIAVPYESPSTTAAQLSDAEATAARRRFNVAPTDFVVILVGKDGTEKLRSQKPLTVDRLCATIDAMPGRQDEMRQKKQ